MPPPVAGCGGGKELLHPHWAWGSKPSFSWAKEGNQMSQREECLEGNGKQKGEEMWNSGSLGIWGFKVFVLRLHWGLDSPRSPKCFLLAAPQKEQLAVSDTETEQSWAPGLRKFVSRKGCSQASHSDVRFSPINYRKTDPQRGNLDELTKCTRTLRA